MMTVFVFLTVFISSGGMLFIFWLEYKDHEHKEKLRRTS